MVPIIPDRPPRTGSADESGFEGDLGPLIEPSRLPPNVAQWSSPGTWTLEEMAAWCAHIHAGQRGVIPVSQRFQFNWTDTGELEDDYQTMAHPQSKLHFDGCSRLWVAWLLKCAAGDSLARDELIYQLPEVPVHERQFVPWTRSQEQALCARALGKSGVHRLLRMVREYKSAGPHQVSQFYLTSRYVDIPRRQHLVNGCDTVP
jgi:hypothetical protein